MKHKRPTSDNELAAMLRRAFEHAQRDEYLAALEICDFLVQDETTAAAGYRERANVRTLMDETLAAMADMRAVLVRCNDEPADHHSFGMLLLKNGDNQEAATMFAKAVALGEAADFFYYTESARLLCTAAYLRLGAYADARELLALVPDGAETYAFGSGVLSKEFLAAELDRAAAG